MNHLKGVASILPPMIITISSVSFMSGSQPRLPPGELSNMKPKSAKPPKAVCDGIRCQGSDVGIAGAPPPQELATVYVFLGTAEEQAEERRGNGVGEPVRSRERQALRRLQFPTPELPVSRGPGYYSHPQHPPSTQQLGLKTGLES